MNANLADFPSARSRRDDELGERIMEIWRESHETYGSPRIHAALRAEGERVGRKRVARLMRELGVRGVTRRRFRIGTTTRDKRSRAAPDLVNRDFTANGPNGLWVADNTQVPTWAGPLYLAVVLDAWSRRVVGWAMAAHMRAELVEDALSMAISRRQPPPASRSSAGDPRSTPATRPCRLPHPRASPGPGVVWRPGR